MQSHWRGNRGFTLVELMIVVIVVGILAAVAIPMYQTIPQRSRATEAVAGLDAVREGMRIYYAEHGRYDHASFLDGVRVTVGGVIGIKDVDLGGRYFSSECYTFDGDAGATTFSIECDGGNSTASAASHVASTVATIDESGDIETSW